MTGVKPDELAKHPEDPPALGHLWYHLLTFKPGTISWQEVWAWSKQTGIKLERWEVILLIILDDKRG